MADRPSAPSPVRMCVGCRTRAPQSDVVRVVARLREVDGSPEWFASLDPDRRLPGRGAYLHRSLTCLELAERRRALPRALRLGGGLDVSAVRVEMHELVGQQPQE
jgi:predicted RNA-binding protein YlxR (DUF448 family)